MTEPQRIGGRYEVGELLGRGGMADVRKGTDVRLGRTVAIKRLRTDLASDATFQARFRREAQSAAKLNHRGIVSVYDQGVDGDTIYLVMEYVPGRTLRDVILIPFEMAIREGGARSVMNSYSEIDGLPVAVDAGLLTGILRDESGFEGTVVSYYWSIVFVQTQHRVAGSPGEAGALSLEAGIDVELPHVGCYAEPLAALVRETMEGALPLSVPLTVDVKVGDDWESMTPLTREDAIAAEADEMPLEAPIAPLVG